MVKQPCKEPGCTEKVEYEPVIVFGVEIGKSINQNIRATKKTVYLTCKQGHCHSYLV